MKRSVWTFAIFCAFYLLVAAFTRNTYFQLILTLTLIWACLGISWNIISGYAGLLSFGHAIFFGLGAYATVLAQVVFSVSPWLMLPVSALIGVVAGLIVGLATFRLRGHYFAFAMLAYPLAVENIFEWLGYQEVTFPRVTENAVWYMQFSDARGYSILALMLLVLAWLISRAIERSRFGAALAAIKQNELAAEAAGIQTLRWKFYAIAVSGAIGAVAGSLYSVVMLIVTPNSVFGMLVSAQALTVAVFGGIGVVWGPIIGAAILVPLGEYLQAQFGSVLPGIQGVLLGVAIIVVVLAAPEGVFWAIRDFIRRKLGSTRRKSTGDGSLASPQLSAAAIPLEATAEHTMSADEGVAVAALQRWRSGPGSEATNAQVSGAGSNEVILSVRSLSRRFGGVQAVHNVSFDVYRGEILGIIGPNGAGKTTLFNLLNGFVKPDTGRVMLNGHDITLEPPHVRCALGLGRTFQVVRPFRRLSVLDNVKLGAYLHCTTEEAAIGFAEETLQRLALGDMSSHEAGSLNNKNLRLMELARAMAGKPQLLLLDETLAGLRLDDSELILAAIRDLANAGVTVVIIEHTMQAMVKLVDEFLVLDRGAVLSRGSVDSVTKDEAVIEAYLGSKWKEGAHGRPIVAAR